MANEATATSTTEATAQNEATATENQAATATPPAGAQTTETSTAEPMIPKSRFDEVNNRLKAIEAEAAKAKKAQTDAETQALAEQGKYKELFEKQQADLAAAQADAKTAAAKLLQMKVAGATKLPAAFAELLKGETEEEMTAHAQTLLAAMPKAAAPNINDASGTGGAPGAGNLDEATKQRVADRFGVDPRYVH